MNVVRAELRGAARKRVLMNATLICASGTVEARIKNFSTSGAHLLCDSQIQAGQEVILKRGGILVAATVVRATATQVALQFYRPLSADQVKSMLHKMIFVDASGDA